jgi:hypothetical protein
MTRYLTGDDGEFLLIAMLPLIRMKVLGDATNVDFPSARLMKLIGMVVIVLALTLRGVAG